MPALLAVLLGVYILALDISLTSTALPMIAVGIGTGATSAIWIVDAYYLAVIAALLPLAALGEIHGHRRTFFAGLGVFALGSFASGLAGSLPALAISRAVVGLGAAAVSATTPALVRSLYPPSHLGRGDCGLSGSLGDRVPTRRGTTYHHAKGAPCHRLGAPTLTRTRRSRNRAIPTG